MVVGVNHWNDIPMFVITPILRRPLDSKNVSTYTFHFYDVSHLVLHTWEETLEGIFIIDYFEQWWGLLMRRPQDGEGRNFDPPLQLLEDKQHFVGEDCNIPKI